MTTKVHLSLEEFLAASDTKPASEYVCGEVTRKPMPDNAHGIIQLYLGALLLQFVKAAGIGRVRTEWRCIFGPEGGRRAYVPDVVYVSFARMPPGDARVNQYVRTAPDLVVEVLSRNQNAKRFAQKLQFYLRHGVRLVWVVDAREETITVFSPNHDDVTLRVGDSLDGGAVLPGFRVAVAEIMAQLQD